MDKKTLSSQRGMAWALTIAFIVLNGLMIIVALTTSFGAARIISISEIVFWFDFISGLVVAAHFGVDFIADYRAGRIGKTGN